MKPRLEKARLPVLSRGPAPAGSLASHAAEHASDAERVAPGRALLCVSDVGAPELALRFACSMLEALRARGRNTALLSVTGTAPALRGGASVAGADALRAGDMQRLRQLGVDPVLVLDERALPDAALEVFSGLPSDCVVVGLGRALALCFVPLLSVRLQRTLPGAAQGASHVDVELGPSMEGAATLIGDWLAACIPAVSSSAAHGTGR